MIYELYGNFSLSGIAEMSTLSYTDDEAHSLFKFLLLLLLSQQELLPSLIGLLTMTLGSAPRLMPA